MTPHLLAQKKELMVAANTTALNNQPEEINETSSHPEPVYRLTPLGKKLGKVAGPVGSKLH